MWKEWKFDFYDLGSYCQVLPFLLGPGIDFLFSQTGRCKREIEFVMDLELILIEVILIGKEPKRAEAWAYILN